MAAWTWGGKKSGDDPIRLYRTGGQDRKTQGI